MFAKTSFNEDISEWDVSNAKTFETMFWNAEKFDQPIGAKWNTQNVTNMIKMFCQAKNFNNGGQPFGEKWTMDKVEWTWAMFWGAEKFNQPINHWNMSKVTKCYDMFMNAKAFDQPLDKWDLSNVVTTHRMFNRADSFNQDLSAWGDKLGKLKDAVRMFANMPALKQTFVWALREDCDTTGIDTNSPLLKLHIIDVGSDLAQVPSTPTPETESAAPAQTESPQAAETTAAPPRKLRLASTISKFKITQIVQNKTKGVAFDEALYQKDVDDFLQNFGEEHADDEELKKLRKWLPKNIREDFHIYFGKAVENEIPLDFFFYKIFGYLFLVETDNKSFQNLPATLKPHAQRFLEVEQKLIDEQEDIDEDDLENDPANPPEMADENEYEDDLEREKKECEYASNALYVKLENERTMFIYNCDSRRDADTRNSNRILNILGALMLAKAYESKMYDFNKKARRAKGEYLMKCHSEICEFDLQLYQNVPVQVYNESLVKFWEKLAERYHINKNHAELKETIASMAQLVADEIRKEEAKIRKKEEDKFNQAMMIIGILSMLGAVFAAIPVFQMLAKWFSTVDRLFFSKKSTFTVDFCVLG